MGLNSFLAGTLESSMKATFLFYVVLIYLPLVFRTVYRMVSEKQSRVKEMMRMMGMTDSAYWISWWIYYSIMNLIICALVLPWLILWVFEKSDPLILSWWFWTYG
jgi:hypothetical protein